MKLLIVYYSYTGNTRGIAETIQNRIGGDLLEIETVNPYTGDYAAVVDQGQDEVNRGFKPELKPLGKDLADYDTILLGTPVWWYTFAPAVKTFLSEHDFSGKTIYPFLTNGGWIGHTARDIEKLCKGAVAKKALNIQFDNADLSTPYSDIERWLSAIR